MKIKMKLSFIAFQRQETIVELFLKQIVKTIKLLSAAGEGENQVEPRTKEEEEVLSKIKVGSMRSCL